MKLKFKKVGNECLSREHKDEKQVMFLKSLDLLTSSILENHFLTTE
jgi:hypothetical protein